MDALSSLSTWLGENEATIPALSRFRDLFVNAHHSTFANWRDRALRTSALLWGSPYSRPLLRGAFQLLHHRTWGSPARIKGAILLLLAVPLMGACAAPRATIADEPALTPEALEELERTRRSRALDRQYLSEIKPFEIDTLRTYYTTVNFWHEFRRHLSTNYQRGVLVPINSRARLSPVMRQDGARKHRSEIAELTVRLLESETTIRIVNVSRHSKVLLNDIVYRMFSPQPIDLSVFDEEMQSLIASGTPREGMTKYQVLLTRGYPPASQTPSLESDTWTYWSSRFSSHALVFSDGRLTGDPGQ